MKRVMCAVVLSILPMLAASPAAATTYTGSLSTTLGGLTGKNDWVDDITFSWIVDDTTNAGLWTYQYTFTNGDHPAEGLSHLIVELSTFFTAANFKTGTTTAGRDPDAPKLYTEQQGNPLMPGNLFGVKYTDGDPTPNPYVFTIVSDIAPTWGDFYAKDGGGSGDGANVVWNTGFLADDPIAPPADGTINNHILRPDSVAAVPEPGSLLLLGTGLVSLGAYGRKRMKKR